MTSTGERSNKPKFTKAELKAHRRQRERVVAVAEHVGAVATELLEQIGHEPYEPFCKADLEGRITPMIEIGPFITATDVRTKLGRIFVAYESHQPKARLLRRAPEAERGRLWAVGVHTYADTGEGKEPMFLGTQGWNIGSNSSLVDAELTLGVLEAIEQHLESS